MLFLTARKYSNKTKQSLAMALSLILAVALPFTYFTTSKAYGALSNSRLQINNSQAAATNATYTFYFTTGATTAIKQIGIKFCTTPGAWGDACTVPTGFAAGTPTLSSDNISGTGRTVTDPNATGERMRIVVGTPAAQSPQTMQLTFTGVTNPSTPNSSFYARIQTYSDTGTTVIDSGQGASAVLDTNSIAISATIDPNLSFSIAAVTSGGTVNGTTTNVTSTLTAIPFGNLTPGTPKIAATDITITTNSNNGYTVTASHSGTLTTSSPMLSGANDIDSFSGTNASPTTWSAPAGSTPNTNTGFFGYTTEDTSLCIGTANRFSGNKWAGTTTTGQEVICSPSGVNSEVTRLGWQTQVNGLQPAGTYNGTLILIATPLY